MIKTEQADNWASLNEGTHILKIISVKDNNGGDFGVTFKVGLEPDGEDNVGKIMHIKFDQRNDVAKKVRYFFLKSQYPYEEIVAENKGKYIDISKMIGRYITADVRTRNWKNKDGKEFTFYSLFDVQRMPETDEAFAAIEKVFGKMQEEWKAANPIIDPTSVEDPTAPADYGEIPF